MRRAILFWCAVIVGIVAVSSFLIYVFSSGMIETVPTAVPISLLEKCSITQVSISESDPDTLLVTVKWKANHNNMNINFTDSIIKDSRGMSVANLGPPIPNELPANSEIVMQLNVSKLSSGRYMVGLVTSAGGYFTSPYFTVP